MLYHSSSNGFIWKQQYLILTQPTIDDLVSKGLSALNEGNFDMALSYFEQALGMDEKNPDLWNHKGTALRSLGRYQEAMDCFNKSLKIDPRDKQAS